MPSIKEKELLKLLRLTKYVNREYALKLPIKLIQEEIVKVQAKQLDMLKLRENGL